MNTHAEKNPEKDSQLTGHTLSEKKSSGEATFQLADNRPEAAAQKEMQAIANNNPPNLQLRAFHEMANNSPHQQETEQFEPVQKKENNTGLPDNLKSGVENLSGYSMNDVRVHYNSDKPAQLQAHAYAQGTDIHLASGQEKHLPHEAWHVVQQKQGRVQPTLQMKGKTDINDDAQLEKEADMMGEKALNTNISEKTAQNTPIVTGSSFQLKVIQLLSSQIEMDEERKIRHIVVRGRPPRAHGSRMGDHTTSFVVQTEGLNIALQNLTIYEAIEKLEGLDFHVRDLISAHGVEVPEAEKDVDLFNMHIASAAISNFTGNEDMAIHHLQLAINAYLRARELVPMSTINVAALSPGLAGKGHGESQHAEVLSLAERGLDDSITDEALIEAVKGLFDLQAAGLVAVETNKEMATSLVGMEMEKEISGAINRLKVIWEQHLASIQTMFPKCYERIAEKLPVEDLEYALKRLDIINIESGISKATKLLKQVDTSLEDLKMDFKNAKSLPTRGSNFVLTKMRSLSGIYHLLERVKQMLPGFDRINNRLNDAFADEIGELRTEINRLRDGLSKELPTYKDSEKDIASATGKHLASGLGKPKNGSSKKDLASLHRVVKGVPSSPDSPRPYDSPAYQPFGEEEDPFESKENHMPMDIPDESFSSSGSDESSMEDNPEENFIEDEFIEDDFVEEEEPSRTITSGTGSMSIQLLLKSGKGGNSITGMLSSGRPASPFSGSMGAHSTAWTVHLDRIRRRVMGKTIPESVTELETLIEETNTLAESLNKLGAMPGDKALFLLDGAKDTMDAQLEINPDEATIDQVQQIIVAILSYLNLLPGISQNDVNTNGNAEGVHRRVLLDYEYKGTGTQEEVLTAIKGLYDNKGAKLQKDHEEFIGQAYPRAANFAKTGKDMGQQGEEPLSNDLDPNSRATGPGKLSADAVEEMRAYYTSDNYLAGVNNCLFNAISDAAGVARPSIEMVIRIREILNVPLGKMLTATRARLDIILAIMGLDDRGAIVFYNGGAWTDSTTNVSEDALYIQHDGVNHFTAARNLMQEHK